MINLLLGFEGRISRTQFWIGLIVVVAAEVVLMLLFGVPLLSDRDEGCFGYGCFEFAIQLVTLYPTAAIAVKRLHDRDQPGIYVLWLVGLTLIIALTNLFGLTDDPQNPTWLDWLAGTVCASWSASRFLFELGFRRGTQGDNRFGPDPLAKPTF